MKKSKIDISIIITVYNRKEFIFEAIKSISTNKVNNIEIVVITNIDLEIHLNEENIILNIIKTDLKSLSQKIKFGIEVCNSDLISFLEDDDIYINDKITRLISIFNRYPEVDFYHNNFNLFRTAQDIHSTSYIENNSLKMSAYKIRSSSKNIKTFSIKLNSGYNLSSIAIRKKIVLNHLNIFDLFDNYGVDTILFFISLAYGDSLFIDKNLLTYIRIHRNNTSGTIDAFYNANHDPKLAREIVCQFETVKEKPFKILLTLFLNFNAIILKIKTGKYSRIELFILLSKHIILSSKLKAMPSSYLIISSIAGLFGYNIYKRILSFYH